MKRIARKIFKGILSGTIGYDLVEPFDKNGDKKVTWQEIKSAPLDTWVKVLVSLGTTLGTILLLK